MIRYLLRKDIDDRKWDQCVQRSFNGNLYGHSWYLDAVADNWDALVEGDYEQAFPLVFRKKLGFRYIYQPFFTQQLGLYSTTILNPTVLETFIAAIPGHFRRAEINLNTHNLFQVPGVSLTPQVNHELDLIHGYAQIGKNYTENLARNLKKAKKAGLSLSQNIQPDMVIRLFRENRGKDIGHLHEKDYLRLKRLIYTGTYKGMAATWGVYDSSNQLCAGAVFFQSHNKIVFLFSGLSPEGRENGAMPFLIDSCILQYSGRQITFDFDGSNDPSLARFYKSFGARECHYPRLTIDRMNMLTRSAYRLYKWFR